MIKIFFCSHIVLLKYEGVFNFDSIKWHLSKSNFYHLTGIFLSSINVLNSKVRKMQLNDFNSILHVLKLFKDLKDMSDLEMIQICTTYLPLI